MTQYETIESENVHGDDDSGIDEFRDSPRNTPKEDEEEYQCRNKRSSPTPISWSVLRYAACAALNSCTLGYDLGVNTSASLLVQTSMDLSKSQIELFVAAMDFFAMIGAACAHFISDRYGRKGLFAISAGGFVVGTLTMSCSHSYHILLVGRAIVGTCVGFGLAVDPIYISEVSPPDRRGELVSWSEIALNIGVVLGFASGLLFYRLPEDIAWRWMFGIGSSLPIAMLIFLSWPGFVSESPRWLVQKGKIREATAVLHTIYNSGGNADVAVDTQIKEIQDSIRRDTEADLAFGWSFLFRPSPAYKRILMVGIGTAVAQQLAGIDAVGAFLVFIMEDSGITSRLNQALTLIALQILKLTTVVVASKMFDKRGRRFFLIGSLLGITASLLLLSLSFVGNNANDGGGNNGVAILGLGSYLICFSVGMGPLAWLIPSEVFPNTIRAKAMSLATFLNRLAGSIMQSTFLTLSDKLGWAGLFVLYAGICILLSFWVFAYLPETKGKKLEEMTTYFAEVTGDSSILDMEASFVGVLQDNETGTQNNEADPKTEESAIITGRNLEMTESTIMQRKVGTLT